MGSAASHIQTEKVTWLDHIILFDDSVRKECLPLIEQYFPLGSKINLAAKTRSFYGATYQHYFLATSCGTRFLEFGTGEDVYTARVSINFAPRSDYKIESEWTVSEEMQQRMRHVVGMKNYSLCLRNCEHVVNYVIRQRWISSQMDEHAVLMSIFKNSIMKETLKIVNSFPSTIRPHVFKTGAEIVPMYGIIPAKYAATEFSYFLDHNEDTYNILVVGPTGAGKSHLINLFFNQKICDSRSGHASVTREVCFIRGTGDIMDFKTGNLGPRKIVVADTVGLCDTEWDDEQIFKLIKGRVSCNFKYIDAVFIVFKADRLLKEHITSMKKIMHWLQYDKGSNCMKFMFVATHAENLKAEEVDSMKIQATKMLGLKDTKVFWTNKDGDPFEFESLVYTGFPPEETLNNLGLQRVHDSWSKLKYLLGHHPGEALQAIKETGGRFHQARLAIGRFDITSCTIL